MSSTRTDGLLDELERLRAFLREEEDRTDLQQHIPVLTDIADHTFTETSERKTLNIISVSAPLMQPSVLQTLYKEDPETELKIKLRRQARIIIQEIIDEELVRVETRLNHELNHYLEHCLNQIPRKG